jgi:hypothetical protein
MSAIRTPSSATPQETGALILRVQLDAAELLRKAEKEERAGSVCVVLPIEHVRELAHRIEDVAALKEAEHLAAFGGRRG